jgi:STE24 endopeptidase
VRGAARGLIAIPVVVAGIFVSCAPAFAAARGPRARLTDYFSPQAIARADSYRGPAYAYLFASIVLNLVVLALLASPVAAGLRARLAGGRWWTGALAMAALVTALPAFVLLPVQVARRAHDRAFGLVTNSLGGFFADEAKGLVFAFFVSAVVAVGFVGIARALPRGWPVVAAAAGALFTFVLVFLLPVVYEPVFNRFAPVDAPTKTRIVAIADAAGVRIRDVLVADASKRTTRENAYVSGIGSTKRVVLYDTLLRKERPREVDLVVAHELSHDRHRDVLNGTILGIVGLWAGVGALWWLLRAPAVRGWARIFGPGDPKAIAFLALFVAVVSVVTLPLQNAISRRVEARADRSAIALTNDPDAAIVVEQHLAIGNVSDLHPNPLIEWMFFTHPSALERIQFALDYKAARP